MPIEQQDALTQSSRRRTKRRRATSVLGTKRSCRALVARPAVQLGAEADRVAFSRRPHSDRVGASSSVASLHTARRLSPDVGPSRERRGERSSSIASAALKLDSSREAKRARRQLPRGGIPDSPVGPVPPAQRAVSYGLSWRVEDSWCVGDGRAHGSAGAWVGSVRRPHRGLGSSRKVAQVVLSLKALPGPG